MNLQERVRAYGVTRLADRLRVSATTLYRWMKTNHVPASQVTALADALDIPMYEAMNLIANPDYSTTPTIQKPSGTLSTLLEVHRGNMTLEEAAQRLQTPFEPLKRSYELNADRLPLLHATIQAYKERRINRKEALKTLDLSPTQFHYLLRTYGETRERTKTDKSPGKYLQLRPIYEGMALDVVASRTTASAAAEKAGLSVRTLHRYITDLIKPRTLTEITHWPVSFRLAWALELQGRSPKIIENLVEYAQKHELVLEKRVRVTKQPENWRDASISTLLRVVLYGEKDLTQVAILRGGAEPVIKNLFNGVLKGVGLRFDQLMSMSTLHQHAVADLLTMIESHYRRKNPT